MVNFWEVWEKTSFSYYDDRTIIWGVGIGGKEEEVLHPPKIFATLEMTRAGSDRYAPRMACGRMEENGPSRMEMDGLAGFTSVV